jgi:hypothetical protein
METVLSKSDFAGKLAAMAPAVRMDGGAEASGAGEGGGEGFRPEFAPLSAQQMGGAKTQFRRVSAPPREDTPSKQSPQRRWEHTNQLPAEAGHRLVVGSTEAGIVSSSWVCRGPPP